MPTMAPADVVAALEARGGAAGLGVLQALGEELRIARLAGKPSAIRWRAPDAHGAVLAALARAVGGADDPAAERGGERGDRGDAAAAARAARLGLAAAAFEAATAWLETASEHARACLLYTSPSPRD